MNPNVFPGSLDMDFPLSGLGTGDLDMDFTELEEFMPVTDSFLTSYLQQLETTANHQQPSVPPSSNTASLASHSLQDTFLEHGFAPDVLRSEQGEVDVRVGLPGNAVGDASTAPLSQVFGASNGNLASFPFVNDVKPDSAGVSNPFVPVGRGSGSDRNGATSGSWDKVDAVSGVQQEDHTDGYSSGRRRREGGKRVRTSVQQQQNKLAQQRYREKRKAKNSELESKVDQLMSQLATLQEVQGQAAQLSGENIALRNQVAKQQQTIEDLRLEMKSLFLGADKGTDCAADIACEAAASSSGPCTKEKQQQCQDVSRRLRASTPEEALQHFGDLVKCIQTSLAEKGLPTDAFMPGDERYKDPVLKQELSRLVGETCLNCMHLFLTRTICPVEKSDTVHTERFQMVPDCQGTKDKWTGCLERIKLTRAQEDLILEQRKELLEALRRVYYERNRLNLMAIGMMLPNPAQVQAPCFDPSPDAKIKCMEVNGSLYCMRTEKQLNDVLDSLKLNLKSEQKLLMEINYKFVHKVLEPAQAAVLMVAAYPSNIDALALANLLAYRRIHGSGATETDIKAHPLPDTVQGLLSPISQIPAPMSVATR